MRHQEQTINHILENYVYADCVARMAATGLVAADVGKVAFQSDIAAYYRLTATTPAWLLEATIDNAEVAAQGSVTAGTRTYLTGSSIRCGKILVGARLRWIVSITKTAAGTGTTTFDIAVGTAGTTADTARVTYTGPTETAVADTLVLLIDMHVRVVSASGILAATFGAANTAVAGAAAGYKSNSAYVASAAFDNTANNLYIGLCITAGTADVTTVNRCSAMGWNIG